MIVICPECIKPMKKSVKPIFIEDKKEDKTTSAIVTVTHFRCKCGYVHLTDKQSIKALKVLYQ